MSARGWSGEVQMARGEIREARILPPVDGEPLRAEIRSRIDEGAWIGIYGAKRDRVIEAALRSCLMVPS